MVGNAITAMARQPEMAGPVRTTMFLGIAFAEALAQAPGREAGRRRIGIGCRRASCPASAG